MSVSVGQLFATNRTAIEERLSRTVHEFGREADAFWRTMQVTSERVVSPDNLGRDYLVHLLYETPYAGVIEPSQVRGYSHLYGDATDQKFGDRLVRRSLLNTWPDPAEGPNSVPFRLTIPMRGFDGSILLSLAEMRADATDASIAKIVARKFRGLGRNIVRRMANYFYADQSNNFRLCSLGPSSGAGAYVIDDGTTKTITFFPPEETCARLHVGEMVDIVRNAAGASSTRVVRLNDSQRPSSWSNPAQVDTAANNQTALTRVRGFVSAVDPLENRVVLTFIGGSGALADGGSQTFADWATTSNIGDNAYIVFHNSHLGASATSGGFQGPAGLNAYIKHGEGGADDYILGDEAINDSALGGRINVLTHPEFRSFKFAVNGPLTEHTFGLYLDRFVEAYEDFGYTLDTIVTRRGVLRAYAAEKIDREIIDRTGRLSSLQSEGSPDKMTYVHNGTKYMVQLSRWVNKGELIAHRRGGGNWKRYVVPKPRGVRTTGESVPSFVPIEFAGPALGMPGAAMPYHNADARPLGGVEMPFSIHYQCAPTEQIPGLRLTGLTENTVYME